MIELSPFTDYTHTVCALFSTVTLIVIHIDCDCDHHQNQHVMSVKLESLTVPVSASMVCLTADSL